LIDDCPSVSLRFSGINVSLILQLPASTRNAVASRKLSLRVETVVGSSVTTPYIYIEKTVGLASSITPTKTPTERQTAPPECELATGRTASRALSLARCTVCIGGAIDNADRRPRPCQSVDANNASTSSDSRQWRRRVVCSTATALVLDAAY